jgi:dTDP-4-amino-4,6-dideoxygalactose transaminase
VLVDVDRLGVSRDVVQQRLHEENIGTGIHFISLHLQPYYRDQFGYRRGDFPQAEYISDRTISLPLSPKLSDEDVEDVIVAVHRSLGIFF